MSRTNENNDLTDPPCCQHSLPPSWRTCGLYSDEEQILCGHESPFHIYHLLLQYSLCNSQWGLWAIVCAYAALQSSDANFSCVRYSFGIFNVNVRTLGAWRRWVGNMNNEERRTVVWRQWRGGDNKHSGVLRAIWGGASWYFSESVHENMISTSPHLSKIVWVKLKIMAVNDMWTSMNNYWYNGVGKCNNNRTLTY